MCVSRQSSVFHANSEKRCKTLGRATLGIGSQIVADAARHSSICEDDRQFPSVGQLCEETPQQGSSRLDVFLHYLSRLSRVAR